MFQRILTVAAVVATLGLLACGEGQIAPSDNSTVRHNDQLTWDQYQSLIFQEPGTGVYSTDGDTVVIGEKNLREFYDTRIANGDMLIVNEISGTDDMWPTTKRHALTYCINKSAFGSHYSAVVQAMTDATAAWSGACDVQWQHLSAQDASCTASNNSVVFDVNPVNVNGQYIARSFFPSTARADRNVLIDDSAFTSSGDPTLTGVLRHELGHTIGFRHEHTRPEAGTCFEDNNWRALTPYDQASVMHYPQCNGISSWALVLTDYDKQGCASLYGAPGGTTTPTCNPACSGKQCGDDGCGGSCGSCSSGTSCSASGTCVAPTPSCTPACSGKQCGDDGCGGSCGSCSSGYSCDGNGVCQSNSAPAPGATSESVNGSVAKGGTSYYGPYAVTEGTSFDVVMSGTGDPDLYVRFGAKPTTSSYACRPYLDGAAEECHVDVPAGQSAAYIMVKGYTASTFSLAISYTKSSGSTPTPPPPASNGTAQTKSFDGSVAAGQSVNEAAITVLAGTSFQVVMSGTGDPDLYVRFGAAPTLSTYNCRPYVNGPGETCTLNVPTGQTTAYIMVNGYADATFHLDVSYTAP
jgi:hypothetical protein